MKYSFCISPLALLFYDENNEKSGLCMVHIKYLQMLSIDSDITMLLAFFSDHRVFSDSKLKMKTEQTSSYLD